MFRQLAVVVQPRHKNGPDIGRRVFVDCERLRGSLLHPEDYVAVEDLLGCFYLDLARGRAV